MALNGDEQEDLDFLQCLDNIDKAGNQGRVAVRVQPKEEGQSEEDEILKNTAAEQLEEAAEQLLTDEQTRMETKKLGVKKQAETKSTLVAKTPEKIEKLTKNRVWKKGGDRGQRVRRKQPVEEQVHTETPRTLLDPVHRELIVLIEKLGSSRARQAKPRQNTTPEPKIEAKQSTSTGEKTYFCPNCDLTSIYKHTVRRHFFRKHQLISYSCADCPFTTTSKDKLKVHITKHHRLFRCSFCPRIYTTFMGRRVHMNAQHAVSSKVFKCKQCDFKSKYQSNMKKHEEMHFEKKAVFRCDSCSYSSNFSNNVRRHALTHLNESEVVMFKCYQCGYDTRWKGDLANHIKNVHVEAMELLQCPLCPFKTKYKACLALHSGKHDNIVYQCEKCIFRTVNKESWKKHCLEHEHS